MFPDVKLKSIQFKTGYEEMGLASVKVNLTNEYTSEVFEQPGEEIYSNETIEFDPNRHVAAVTAREFFYLYYDDDYV